ncbi:hypothetical protein C4J81_15700 [Deltaproteobacteria bacterium Smac51]|nr:hypothetical protein C4J81_15700 [Deltaproteobacteria bacterium Smac51]
MDIQPEKQNIDQVFARTVYYIDFYQRDYKWASEPVNRLLEDIFYQFDESYERYSDLDANKENINAKYPWYYLNTYVTNNVDGKDFVVDGQQRLTTITLILIKLYHLANKYNSKTNKWIESKIAGYSGTEHEFWMNHINHIHVLKNLLDAVDLNEINTSSGITAEDMVANYSLISAYLDDKIKGKDHLEAFIYYFLLRLVLVNLSVETQHVPMVFEVINDRGVRLKPYEILKGKLLGQIDKDELASKNYNETWDCIVRTVNSFREDEVDNFFRYWLKGKFSGTRKEGQRFDGDYHREMFKADMDKELSLDHNPRGVKTFLDDSFEYYTGLYSKIWRGTQDIDELYPSVYYNSLNEQDGQFMLILSSCRVRDSEEDEKIKVVSQEIDRIFSLLQLQGVYDSNSFAELIFKISIAIREKPVKEIKPVFTQFICDELADNKNVASVSQPFSYTYFKNMTVDRPNKRFIRYLFARVELLLANAMKVDMRHPIKNLVTNRGVKTGFHVEHILAHNKESLESFGHDEERFEVERNRLGGVLLLKGLDNISSNDECYAEKLKTYANSLYWNETLRKDTYKSKIDFQRFIEQTGLAFKSYDSFGPHELEERHRLLFDLCCYIWEPSCIDYAKG